MAAAAAAIVGGITLWNCSDDATSPSVRELRGEPVSVGSGTARTVVTMNGDSALAVAVELSSTALDGLPADMSGWTLPLPTNANVAPYDHVTLNWNPAGHPPPGIYSVPHFDFHFYMVSSAAQAAVVGGPEAQSPAPQYVPTDYVPDPVAVPDMGVHWTDSTAKEFHGQPFTSTFIYGSHENEFTFLEPMVTVAFLSSRPAFTQVIKTPAAVQHAGRYPTAYSVRYDPTTSTVRISLDGLVKRD
ncbi:MAG TPA: DUF5602 domain-containing protein [Gemmatimonadaceae bacterium]|nr:DUF5602 domain-containing protein [Gemmatimonadaceae bacterium]